MKQFLLVISLLLITLPVKAGQYQYDVSGYRDGNYVYGEIDADSSKYGDGTIYNENGDSKHIDFEWTGKGELEATDEDGETFDLEVD